MLKISAVVLIPCLTAVLLLLLSYIAYIYWRFLVRITTKNKPLKCLKTESATLGNFDIMLYLFSKKLTPKLGDVIPKFGNGHENATSFWPRRFDSGNLKKKFTFDIILNFWTRLFAQIPNVTYILHSSGLFFVVKSDKGEFFSFKKLWSFIF